MFQYHYLKLDCVFFLWLVETSKRGTFVKVTYKNDTVMCLILTLGLKSFSHHKHEHFDDCKKIHVHITTNNINIYDRWAMLMEAQF
jgi:hypothetical protein